MIIIPLHLATANDFVARHHRHHGPVVGAKFSIGVMHSGDLVGVAIVGRPVARGIDDGFTAEVTRCCVLESAPKGACSKLYSACQRAWFAMGGKRLVTYTLNVESGASLRGAGWQQSATVRGRGWDCPSRRRRSQQAYLFDKVRWEAKTATASPGLGGVGA